MNSETIRYLSRINDEFYRATAREFDQTRKQGWQGWTKLLSFLPGTPLFSALDVGCGNGRFGVFLAENIASRIAYHGVDNNATLLRIAQESLSKYPHVTAMFERRDIIEKPPDSGLYDLVGLFGVLHHIPGAANRMSLIGKLAERVKPGGLLVFACWRFYEYERFRNRIVPWGDNIQVEEHDYLLDWQQGKHALRYCHYIHDEEHDALVAAAGLHEMARYRADGHTGDANCYSILQNQANAPSIRRNEFTI